MSTPLEEAAKAVAADMGIPPDEPMTAEQAAEFKRLFAEIVQQDPWRYKILNQPRLTKDEVRQLLRECVIVVKPGETLIIRAYENWTPNQIRELQDSLNAAAGWRDLGFKVLVVPGADFAVALAEITHQCPPDGEYLMPCCGLTPFEAPKTDRMTLEPSLVTCGKAAAGG